MALFEESAVLSKRPAPLLFPRCGACGLSTGCKTPKMKVQGQGRRKILLVGTAPDRVADAQGRHWAGPALERLSRELSANGIDIERDCWHTSANVCSPQSGTVTAEQVDSCRPLINQVIAQTNPEIIIPLGGAAVQSVLKPMWLGDTFGIDQWAGWRIPLQKTNTWVCPTYSPVDVINYEDRPNGRALKAIWTRHISDIAKLSGRPWSVVPDYEKTVKICMDTDEAARILRKMLAAGGGISFDYETNMLKPDGRDAKIVSCAVCHRGERTLAYPWTGEAVKATSELLRSNLPKIGANIKFEERWTRAMLGHGVKNWVWDCMLAAHYLDNRRGITSVKFQSFVQLGLEPWNEHIQPYLESPGASIPNRIEMLGKRELLTYNGIDAVVEYKLAQVQRGMFNQ